MVDHWAGHLPPPPAGPTDVRKSPGRPPLPCTRTVRCPLRPGRRLPHTRRAPSMAPPQYPASVTPHPNRRAPQDKDSPLIQRQPLAGSECPNRAAPLFLASIKALDQETRRLPSLRACASVSNLHYQYSCRCGDQCFYLKSTSGEEVRNS